MVIKKSEILKNSPILMAQITDSHLFSSPQGLHCGHNVLENLRTVLISINNNPQIDFIVFTGDLTQDHTEQSYQNFVDCVHECGITLPFYYLAGNHDEPELLNQHFSASPFKSDKEITLQQWQIQLVDSKSDTPAGYVSKQALIKLKSAIKQSKHQLLMMHHHPIDVGYFIDKHGLQNKAEFWQTINAFNNIKAIACGHVHGAMELTLPLSNVSNNLSTDKTKAKYPVTLYTCPATSIQFDPTVNGVGALDTGPGYRTFTLYEDGSLDSDVVYIDK